MKGVGLKPPLPRPAKACVRLHMLDVYSFVNMEHADTHAGACFYCHTRTLIQTCTHRPGYNVPSCLHFSVHHEPPRNAGLPDVSFGVRMFLGAIVEHRLYPYAAANHGAAFTQIQQLVGDKHGAVVSTGESGSEGADAITGVRARCFPRGDPATVTPRG